MLSKIALASLGYEISLDPDQPGRLYWRNGQMASDISYDSVAEALQAAGKDAMENTSWECVADYFGLDDSFCWSEEDVRDYTLRYIEALAKASRKAEFVERVAALQKWGEPDEDGQPFESIDGYEDSHRCLMHLIDEARALLAALPGARQANDAPQQCPST